MQILVSSTMLEEESSDQILGAGGKECERMTMSLAGPQFVWRRRSHEVALRLGKPGAAALRANGTAVADRHPQGYVAPGE